MTQDLRIAFMGDITADKYMDTSSVKYGGAALNMAMWAKRIGIVPEIVSAVGDDQIGDEFLNLLVDENLSSACVQQKPGKTSAIEIFLENGERRYGTWEPGVLSSYHVRTEDFEILQNVDAIAITVYPAYLNVLEEFSQWRQTQAPEERPLLCINYGDLKEFGNSIDIPKQYIDSADILVFGLDSEKDAAIIRDVQTLSRPDTLIVTTLGKHGSRVRVGLGEFFQPAFDAHVVDTTGAGDSFLVGFLSDYLTRADVSKALIAGSQLAVKAISTIGAY